MPGQCSIMQIKSMNSSLHAFKRRSKKSQQLQIHYALHEKLQVLHYTVSHATLLQQRNKTAQQVARKIA